MEMNFLGIERDGERYYFMIERSLESGVVLPGVVRAMLLDPDLSFNQIDAALIERGAISLSQKFPIEEEDPFAGLVFRRDEYR